jgi:TrmH family RNA methyltransferase
VQRITSRQNAIVARYREASRGGAGQPLLLDGTHLVSEAVAAGIHLQHMLVAADAVDTPEISELLAGAGPRVEVAAASSSVMDAVSPVRSSSPIVALGSRPSQTRSPFEGPSPLVVVACDVQDPGNLGAIIRVAEAAGASGVIVAGASADPFGWKALRGSMGSALRMPIATAPSVDAAMHDARGHHAQVVATVPRDGVPLHESDLTRPTALLIGGEGPGLPAHVIHGADVRVSVPMDPQVESLNAAVAAAVLLYEAYRQRNIATHAGSEDPAARRRPAASGPFRPASA